MTTINVDESEVAKFERLAHRWWDKEGEAKPLHQMNPIRANYIDEKAPVAESKVLDVGCGGGLLCEALAQRGANVTGIDMGEAPLEVARLHAIESQLNIRYLQSTAEAHAENQAQQYDIVTCLEMLEHVPDPSAVIKACAELVKPGGNLFFSTINRNPKAYAFAVLGAEYLLKALPKGTHDYNKFIRPSELAAWCRRADLSVMDVCGITYNPITQKFKTNSNDVDINYILHAKRPD